MTHEVIPVPAASLILERIYSPGSLTWAVTRIDVLNPIHTAWEMIGACSETRRRAYVLCDVAYVIAAELVDLNGRCASSEHRSKFARRRDQNPDRPVFLGLRECGAVVATPRDSQPNHAHNPIVDLGWMPLKLGRGGAPTRFFRATMVSGSIHMAAIDEAETAT